MPTAAHRPWALVAVGPGPGADGWWRFDRPVGFVTARVADEVLPCLHEVDRALADGYHAAGYVAYEAGSGFDPALPTASAGDLPVAWWAFFGPPALLPQGPLPARLPSLPWRASLGAADHRRAVRRIRRRIADGEVYQVNLTFPLEAPFDGDAFELFRGLLGRQPTASGAYLDGGPFAVCSASPELFFHRHGERILSRPMKGTARRGPTLDEDRRRAGELAASSKERAENLMIVDMVRNDLGRIARAGSVRVDSLFDIETYPTVHQLTSTVSAETAAPLSEVFRALFPAASITGAPKVRASHLIRELESAPRGIYTGAIGYASPDGRATFNVAIRTVTVDRRRRRALYGTGGGIVWDSRADREYDECRAKALVLTPAPPRGFDLLETLLWRPRSGYFLLRRHLDRLLVSAEYFGFRVERSAVLAALRREARSFLGERHRVRLKVGQQGDIKVEPERWPCTGPERWALAVDDRPVDSEDPFLHHKTTYRRRYDEASARFPASDDVILWNERGELTETTRANLALKIEGCWWTPVADSGLLAGTYRRLLLERGRLREATLPRRALAEAEAVAVVNSLRGWIHVRRVDGSSAADGDRPSRAIVIAPTDHRIR